MDMDVAVSDGDPYAEKLLAAALMYASFGWKVVPCYEPVRAPGGGYVCACGDPNCVTRRNIGKHPYFDAKILPNGLRNASSDPTIIRRWWKMWPRANIAVVGGAVSNLVIVDFDFPKGGNDCLRDLEVEHGPLSDATKVRTGNGIHVYFQHPGGRIPSGTGVLGSGVDIRADDGYGIAPPSFHPRGHEYQWIGSTPTRPDDIQPMPTWLVEFFENRAEERRQAIETNRTHRAQGGRSASSFTLEEKMRRCQAYVSTKPGVSEGGRNDAAAKSVCPIGLDFDLDEDEFWPILQSWNARNGPPLDDRELRRTLFSANRSREYPRGCKLEQDSDEWSAKQAEWSAKQAEYAERESRYAAEVQTRAEIDAALWEQRIKDAEHQIQARGSRVVERGREEVPEPPPFDPPWLDEYGSEDEYDGSPERAHAEHAEHAEHVDRQPDKPSGRSRKSTGNGSSNGGNGGGSGNGGNGNGGDDGGNDEEPTPKRGKPSGKGDNKLRSTALMDLKSSASLWGPDKLSRTDLGNAQRILRDHGNDIRYVAKNKRWYLWTECKWAEDEKGEIMGEMVAKTMRSMHKLVPAANMESDESGSAWRTWIKSSESKRGMTNSLDIAGTFSSVSLVPEDFDQQDLLVNTPSGVVDIRDFSVRPPDRKLLMSKVTAVGYDPDQKCPTWLKFLHRIFKGDQELIDYFQRAAGYSLTGSTREQCLFFCYGTGKNGKSTAITAMQEVTKEYARAADIATFLEKNKNDSMSNDLARLCGARFVAATEPDRGKRLDEAAIKRLTGQDKITARLMYAEFFEFTWRAKIWIAANHKPKITGTDEGIWRRIRLIPFTVQITEAEKDPDLDKKLRKEYPGILAWMLEGAHLWHKHGLGMPEVIRLATMQYRKEMDRLADFMYEMCITNPDIETQSSLVYNAYKAWSSNNGERYMGHREFTQALAERNIVSAPRKKFNVYVGLGLLAPGEERQEEDRVPPPPPREPGPDDDDFDGPLQQGFDD